MNAGADLFDDCLHALDGAGAGCAMVQMPPVEQFTALAVRTTRGARP